MSPPTQDVDLLKCLLTCDSSKIPAVFNVYNDIKKIQKALPKGQECAIMKELHQLNLDQTIQELRGLPLAEQTEYFIDWKFEDLTLSASILIADFILRHETRLVRTSIELLLDEYNNVQDNGSADKHLLSNLGSPTLDDSAVKK